MDFMYDTLANGEAVRVLTLVDMCTRELLALRAVDVFRAAEVVKNLQEAIHQHQRPAFLQGAGAAGYHRE
jgi:transposase InsO family protein